MGLSGNDACMLVTPAEAKAADRIAAAQGTTLDELVQRAGSAVADVVRSYTSLGGRIAVLAGPGLNGDDARAAAELLADDFDVRLFQLKGEKETSGKGDSGADKTRALADFRADEYDLVLDGLFGIGLSREIEGPARVAIEHIRDSDLTCIAIDIPSGVDGSTGQVLGCAVSATATVTFERRKPGHLLLPGKDLCGDVIVADIGITNAVWARVSATAYANEPGLWLAHLKHPSLSGHKYNRGHAVVMAGPAIKGGAARLSANGALRGGAGLVTLAVPSSSIDLFSTQVTAIMLRSCDDAGELADLLFDKRYNAFVLGPGFGDADRAREYTSRIIGASRAIVLDADAITAYQDSPDELFRLCRDAEMPVVATPHGGEFARLFPDIAGDASLSKLQKAVKAAERSGAVVVSKGADTVIAEPGGRAAINATGTPWLATAGTGDVLTGIIAAQLAQGTPAFEAACAGVWMHGRAAELFGPGLISEDLPQLLPRVHVELQEMRKASKLDRATPQPPP